MNFQKQNVAHLRCQSQQQRQQTRYDDPQQTNHCALRKFPPQQYDLNNSYQQDYYNQYNDLKNDMTPQRHYSRPSDGVNGGICNQTQPFYATNYSNHSALSPINSHFSPSAYDYNQINQTQGHIPNQLENTKSMVSATQSTGGTQIMHDIRSLIAKQDQNIQNKLKQLAEFKDTLTGSVKISQYDRESFNRTKLMQSKQIHNETKSSNANDSMVAAECPAFINSERNTNYEEEQNDTDQELKRLRDKYDLDQANEKRKNEDTQHIRFNSQTLDLKNVKSEEEQRKERLNKSFETFNTKGSYFKNNTALTHEDKITLEKESQQSNGSRKAYIAKLINTNSIQNNSSKGIMLNNPSSRESDIASRQNESAPLRQTFNTDIPPKSQSRQQTVPFSERIPENHFEQQQQHIQNITVISDLPSNPTDRSHIAPSELNIPKYSKSKEHRHSKKSSHRNSIGNSKKDLHIVGQDQNLKVIEDHLDNVKLHQREQNTYMQNISLKIDQNELTFTKQLSKSVERITSELSHLKQIQSNAITDQEQRFKQLEKEVRDIKRYTKRISRKIGGGQRHLSSNGHEGQYSQSQLSQENSQLQTQTNQYTNTTYQGNNYTKESQQFMQNSSYYQRPYQTQIANQFQESAAVSAYFGSNRKYQNENVAQEGYYKQESKHYHDRELDTKRKQPQQTYDLPVNSNCPTQTSPIRQELPFGHITLSNPQLSVAQQTINNNQNSVNGHTISYHTEIEKVREESSKRIVDLKGFYEKELKKMREEFENREFKLKENMQSQIKSQMEKERQKVTEQLHQIQIEKENLEEKLISQSRFDKKTSTQHSRTFSQHSPMGSEQPLTELNSAMNTSKSRIMNQISQKIPQMEQYIAPMEEKLYETRPNVRRSQRSSQRGKESENSNKKRATEPQKIHKRGVSQKENILYVPTPVVHGMKNEKLELKEKEILRRINKIENFLNRN